MRTPVFVNLDDAKWEPCGEDGDPRARLIATLSINGAFCHLEAYAVVPGSDPQETVDGWMDSFDRWSAAADGDGPFETCMVGGREYVLFMSPYCQ